MPSYSQTGHQLSSVGKKYFETQTVQDVGTELQPPALPSRSATLCSRPWLTPASQEEQRGDRPSIWLLPRPGVERRLRQTVSYTGDIVAAGSLRLESVFVTHVPHLNLTGHETFDNPGKPLLLGILK